MTAATTSKAPFIVNIQRYSVHDGGGIRSTVFFKGCPLACRWCHNPETQSFDKQLMFYAERCTGCGACVDACPERCIAAGPHGLDTAYSDCTACGACADACSFGAREVVGRQYSINELVALLTRDQKFYENSGGGVTLSGGEPMVQDIEYIEALLKRLKRRGIHTAIDTCGDAPWESFRQVLPHCDVFLFDLKALTPELHRRFTGRDNARILENLRRLSDCGAAINLRVPVIENCNAHDAEITAIINFARENVRSEKVNLLPYHRTGRDKLDRLGGLFEDDDLAAPTDERIKDIAARWRDAGFAAVEIGG